MNTQIHNCNHLDPEARITSELALLDARRQDLLTALRIIREPDPPESDKLESLNAIDGQHRVYPPSSMAHHSELGYDRIADAAQSFFQVDIDLSDTFNNAERLVRIAEAYGKPLHPMLVAAFLKASGQSDFKDLFGYRSHVYNDLVAHPDFRKLKGGYWEYVPVAPGPAETDPESSYESATELGQPAPSIPATSDGIMADTN